MTLGETLEVYKSTKKIYINEYIDESTVESIGLYSDINTLPKIYLQSEVVNWTYKLDAANITGTNMAITPMVTLKIERG